MFFVETWNICGLENIISNAWPPLTLGVNILPLFTLLCIFDFKMKAIL